MEIGWESQKIQGKGKIGEIMRNFDIEKNRIIQEYENKKQKYDTEL